jgi:acetyl-CoA carboxylase biotin carboxyl carrier protein
MNTDYDYIRQLVELMAAHDLSRVELHEGDTHIVLRRGHPLPAAAPAIAPTYAPAPVPAAPPAAPSAAPPAPAAADAAETYVRSPMVGTFYAAPDPESPPFVSIGASIGPQSVVCLIEAMKVFNEIKAECSGRVSRILVKNGEAVEFDQPLFAITT